MARTETTGARRCRALRMAPVSAALAFAGAACGQPLSFDYDDFSNPAGLTLIGGTVHVDNTLCITEAVASSHGATWYTAQKAPVAWGFTTTFRFRLRDIGSGGADGLAFVVQNASPGELGGTGGALGYATNLAFSHLPGQTGIANSLAVEIDTWNNQANWGDFSSDNHVSLQTQGVSANRPDSPASLAWAVPGVNMSDTLAHLVLVEYLAPAIPGGLGVLSVELDESPLFSIGINLENTLNLDAGRAWVGFTAATGGGANAEVHELLDWHYFGNIPAPGSAVLLGASALIFVPRRRRIA